MGYKYNAEIVREGLHVRTCGLKRCGQDEIDVSVRDISLLDEVDAFIKFIIQYLEKSQKQIKVEETLNYGYWLVKFMRTQENHLDVLEYNEQATEFCLGATLTLSYWKQQHEICARAQANFLPPRPDKLVVISNGVFEGDFVHGTRYPSPDHMSGWWVLTDRWDGETRSLRTEHLYHLTARRPELAKYLALPFGFMFDLRHGESIAFDKAIANQKIPE